MIRLRGIRRLLGRFARDRSGNATMEFVILAPMLFYFIFSLGEAGTMMARSVMLERGLDMAIRDLRLGLIPGITHDQLKDRVCEGAFLLGSCEDVLLLEVVPLTDPSGFPVGPANCVDRANEIVPATTFDAGTGGQIMFVRACLVVDPVFPGSGLGALLPVDESGGYAIVTQSAFVNEPSE